ncbi:MULTISPECIES: proline--tRNA ligase [Kitasatospora]|uniref:Proline--tRNA ligase n=1 Tax=Kitasatospora setae (strain ATCC 33774 / DSM 43861 / JCM 3304 / KCC A-0304 / NBRC 14216 / KM-6054) TaxID=452652 RepID=E4NEE8_KITSK|nr:MULTISPECIES: proline--tRNA ligase [Kitasatospora]BAJ29579.1 putative prolyl-tRNA synthetase [Kitasatospora setae KM-6054]
MRWSQLYVPTLREDPADADAASHRLLVRAGYVRQLAAGHYSLLPLAARVRARIVAVVREEMERIGAQEFLLPALHPAELWRRTGRWESMGEEMFRLTDRKGAEQALGMTHEEVFAHLAEELRSYRQLPQTWYQFQTKFRDEARPRSGLLRVREFTMKDSYSFDLDEAGMARSFEAHRLAYLRIFERLGLPAFGVRASSGAMGGSGSVEFMSPSAAGEDLVVRCPGCGYAANTEKALSALPAVADPAERTERTGPAEQTERTDRSDQAGTFAVEEFATPGARGIEELAERHGIAPERQLKTLVQVVDGALTLVLLRGDHALVEQKLLDALGASAARPATAEEIAAALGASPGSLGPLGGHGLPVLADEALRGRTGLTCGANRDGFHLRGVSIGRDVRVTRWADLREVTAGEPCAECGAALEVLRTIEVGHIFQLGRRYTEALGVAVAGPAGERVVPLMGSYGIGVERLLAALVEAHHDERGIRWPAAVAPFDLVLTVLPDRGGAVAEAAERLCGELGAAGVRVLLDDRAERPGVKFADAELIGVPWRLTLGARGLAAGTAELTARADGSTRELGLDAAVPELRALAG